MKISRPAFARRFFFIIFAKVNCTGRLYVKGRACHVYNVKTSGEYPYIAYA